MRYSKITLAALAGCCVFLAGARLPALDRVISQKANAPKSSELKGRIIKDDFMGVSLVAAGGLRTFVPRNEVRRVIYGAVDYRAFDAGMDKYRAGDYARAYKLFEASGREVSKLPDNQKALFGQYLSFYKAMCRFKAGEEAEKPDARRKQWTLARDAFAKLLARVEDTAFYFDCMINDARCLEAFSVSRARERYKFLAATFDKKISDGGRRLSWARKYSFQAKMALLRLDMESKLKQKGREADVSRLLAGLKSKQSTKIWEKYADVKTISQATRIESMALTYLKRFKDLAKILDKRIRQAQKVDAADALGALYVQRGNACFNLAAQAKDAAAKKELQQKALLDYLRADLLFDLNKRDKGIANLRLGMLFADLRESKDWKSRAKTHLKVARQCGVAEAREVENRLN